MWVAERRVVPLNVKMRVKGSTRSIFDGNAPAPRRRQIPIVLVASRWIDRQENSFARVAVRSCYQIINTRDGATFNGKRADPVALRAELDRREAARRRQLDFDRAVFRRRAAVDPYFQEVCCFIVGKDDPIQRLRRGAWQLHAGSQACTIVIAGRQDQAGRSDVLASMMNQVKQSSL